MPVCGEPHPTKAGVFCVEEDSGPHDHIHPPSGSAWGSEQVTVREQERSIQRRSCGGRTRRQIMLEAARSAQPDDRVGPYVLDREAAMAGANAGVARADAGADTAWKARARDAILQVARRQSTVHVDDVWVILGDDVPREGRALGAVFRQVQREGVLEMTDQARRTARADSNHHWRPIWRSLLYNGPAELPR